MRTINLGNGVTADIDIDEVVLSDNSHVGICINGYQLSRIVEEYKANADEYFRKDQDARDRIGLDLMGPCE